MTGTSAPLPAMPAQQSVQTGTFSTAYYRGGEGSGRPVILVHGGGAGAESVSNWQRSFPLFAANGPTYAMDMVGFGNSDAPSPEEFAYTQDARNQQLIDFIEALDLGPARLIGNSMGGCTSLGVAMKRPDLVDSLVLMGSGGRAKAGALSPDLGPVIHYDFTIEGMRAIIGVLANPGFIPSDEQVEYRYEMSIRPELKVAYKATMGWVRENGLYYPDDAIAAVKTRTLVVNGKEDKVVPIEQAYEFLALLENSTGYLIPHCRHWAMIEYPELFSKVCINFLNDTTDYGVAS
jgi:pimeloyl-ACP methyl ester carboxylesterase